LVARVQSQLDLRAKAIKAAQEQTSNVMSALAQGMAHELRNAANGVVQAVECLRSLLPKDLLTADSPAGQLFAAAEIGTTRLREISAELLGFNGRGEVVGHEVSWPRIVEAARGAASAHFRGVKLIYDEPYVGNVWGAEQMLVSVLSNLLINGAQAARAG